MKWRFQTFKSGQVNTQATPEKLLPTGTDQQEDENAQTNKNQKVEPLYPLGVNPKD